MFNYCYDIYCFQLSVNCQVASLTTRSSTRRMENEGVQGVTSNAGAVSKIRCEKVFVCAKWHALVLGVLHQYPNKIFCTAVRMVIMEFIRVPLGAMLGHLY